MNIGYFVGHFPYPNLVNTPDYIKKYAHGGTEIAAYNLAVNMANRGNMIDVFTTSIDSNNSVEVYPNMNVHRHGTSLKIASANPSIKLIYNPLNYDMDLVHAHSPIPYSDLPALLYSKRKKLPFILTYQFDGIETGGSFIRNAGVSIYNKLFIHRVLNSADVIIATTKSYAEKSPFLRGYMDKIVVIPNGINIDEVSTPLNRQESREKLDLPTDQQIILFFGSLVEYKGPDVLLKAFKLVKKEFSSVKLIFAGRGHMISQLKTMTKQMDLEEDVIFTGFVEDGDKPAYYKSADIFCLPSTTMAESFGIVNLEAMAAGIPIVSSNMGGIPDVVKHGENGLLAKPYDVKMVAENLIKLLKDDEMRKEMGEKGLKMIKNYSWDKITIETEKLYKKTLENY